ncbi:hypothetical protein ACP70R_018894 [Stipagrostis hirtigluma subsp. patula]
MWRLGQCWGSGAAEAGQGRGGLDLENCSNLIDDV